MTSSTREHTPSAVARWVAAVMCFVYGFAKIMEGRRTSETEMELAIKPEAGGGLLRLRRVRPALK